MITSLKLFKESLQTKSYYKNCNQQFLINLIKKGKIANIHSHKKFISLSLVEDSGGQDDYGNVRIEFDGHILDQQGAQEVWYDTDFFRDFPEICKHITGFKNEKEYYKNLGFKNAEEANDSSEISWEQLVEGYAEEEEVVIKTITFTDDLIKKVTINDEELLPELKQLLVKHKINFFVSK